MSMRKIDSEMVDAVRRRIDKSIGNTVVRTQEYSTGEWREKVTVTLHGNQIAIFHYKKDCGLVDWNLSTCGWDTQTTLRRLNALLQNVCGHSFASFHIVDGEAHLFYGKRDLGCVGSVSKEEYREMYVASLQEKDKEAK